MRGGIRNANPDREALAPRPFVFDPLRKLALGVIAAAVAEATSDIRGKTSVFRKKERGTAWYQLDPLAWLSRPDLVKPWCDAAEISISRLRQRIAELKERH